MQSWQVVVVALVAVLVGATVPVLLQLRSTLKQMERRMRFTGRKLDRTLDDFRVAVGQVNRLGAGLEGGEQKFSDLVDALSSFAQTLNRLRGTVAVASAAGAALGPALTAFLQGMRQPAPTAQGVVTEEGEDVPGNGHESEHQAAETTSEEGRHGRQHA